ncbi:MAG: hypothetical protein JWM47_547 [Acidimicrobiales bacterium]|nr:hypothetical protein [Acidimicrobiales bacterium]
MARTLILLPPSEGKAGGGRGAPWSEGRLALPDLDRRRTELLAALGPDHPAVVGGTRPAIDRYTGVLYRELDAGSLDAAARSRLTRQALILSGLWGAVAPRDPIPDYKLKMGARVASLGTLSTWWRPHLTEALAPRVLDAVVWDLLPGEHAAAVDWRQLHPGKRVTVRFLDRSGRTVAHWNKLLKGSIVRWLVETGADDPADLAELDHPQGYRLDRDASSFSRREAALVLREGG